MKGTIIICFIGIDGSGKSTLSRRLYEELKERRYRVSHVWWLEGENSLLRRLLRRAVKLKHLNLESDANISKTNSGYRTITTTIFGRLYSVTVFLDYLWFGIVKVWLPKTIYRDRIVIFDRFIYDIVLAIAKQFNFTHSHESMLYNLYSKLLPHPNLMFIIDVPPEVSYSRRKEEYASLEDAKVMWEDYQKLYHLLTSLVSGKIVKVNNSREVESVKSEILDVALEFLKNNG